MYVLTTVIAVGNVTTKQDAEESGERGLGFGIGRITAQRCYAVAL